ncbi:hypothetical protein D3C76_1772950 [compost metagenome]
MPPAYLLNDPQLYKQAYRNIQPALSPDGLFPEHGPTTALRALVTFEPGLRDTVPDPASTWTNAFVDKALQAIE